MPGKWLYWLLQHYLNSLQFHFEKDNNIKTGFIFLLLITANPVDAIKFGFDFLTIP